MDKFYSVYGTLRHGEGANYMMSECEFVSTTTEKLNFKMVDLGSFPALIESKDKNDIVIETYKLPADGEHIENRLDLYEGYCESGTGLYDKKLIKLDSGIESFVYFMKNDRGKIIKSGDWKNK